MLNLFSRQLRDIPSKFIHKIAELSEGHHDSALDMPRFRTVFWSILDRLRDAVEFRSAFEEANVSKDVSLDVPVILYTRDVLRGERLTDSMIECLQDLTPEHVQTAETALDDKAPINGGMLPRLLNGPAGAIENFTLELFENTHLRTMILCQNVNPNLLATLYPVFVHLRPKLRTLEAPVVISPSSLPTFIHLMRANPTSAAFSFLVMYAIRHRTLIDQPETFESIFLGLTYSERLSHDIGKFRKFF